MKEKNFDNPENYILKERSTSDFITLSMSCVSTNNTNLFQNFTKIKKSIEKMFYIG